jgi:hypothetical protein
MEKYKIIEVTPNDPRIYRFREKVVTQDLKTDFNDLLRCTSRGEIFEKYKFHPEFEEIYKFSQIKWEQSAFGSIYGLEIDDEIVSISGTKIYSDLFVRLGMNYYTLRKFRSSARSIMWRTNGFVDKAIKQFPQNHFFITIYAHNAKLQAWSKKLTTRNNFGQMSVENKDIIDTLFKFKPICQMRFNNVPQLLLHHSPSNTILPDAFFSAIGATV